MMAAAIATIARSCLGSFSQLTVVLASASTEHRESMPPEKLEWEFGRFKTWCGNLGALQSGKSSLDSRLRESTVMRTTMLKHLARLDQALVKSTEVVSGARLQLDKQPNLDDSSDEYSSEESDDENEPPKELVLHMVMIKDILNDLYKLSFRLRNSSTRASAALRPKLYSEIDDETGVDKFIAYSTFDKRHVEDSLLQLRRDSATEMRTKFVDVAKITDADQYLIDRLVAAMCNRRKILRYWQRHAQKLAHMPKDVRDIMEQQSIPNLQTEKLETQSTLEKHDIQVQYIAPSAIEQTILSKTEATRFDSRLDNMLETQSNISYASTAVDFQGFGVDLPTPPSTASKGSEFLCPYCGIVCPARHGKDRAWRAHILQDLQPYTCTYERCEDGDHLFSSRTAWAEHERLGHRRVWQCFKHTEPKFLSRAGLQHHLESEHPNDITETQIQNLVEVSESSTEETRSTCPFCLLRGPFPRGLENHMASHMQAFAAFSVSRNISAYDDDEIEANEDQSACAQGLGSQDSQRSDPLQFDSQPPSDAGSDSDEQALRSPSSSIWGEPAPNNPRPRVPIMPISIKDFEIIKPISKGRSSSVYLAKTKSGGEYYAMKVLKHVDMAAKNHGDHTKSEVAGILPSECDFVAKLYASYTSKEYSYLVTEYLNGGDCASLVRVLGNLPEEWTKKYIAELVLIIEYLHNHGITHYNLKPGNVLIDQYGHLKLTDLGLSFKGLIDRLSRMSRPSDSGPISWQPQRTTPLLTINLVQHGMSDIDRQGLHSGESSGKMSRNQDGELSRKDDQPMQHQTHSHGEKHTHDREGLMEHSLILPEIRQSSTSDTTDPLLSSATPPDPMALNEMKDKDDDWNLAGMFDYIAPETIIGSNKEMSSDWWSLGCILFEFLFGDPPFHTDTPVQDYQIILSGKFVWPVDDHDEYEVSDEARSLVFGLLRTDPEERLGSNKNNMFASGAEEVKSHPWFADIDWKTIREDEAPFIPATENVEDTANFDSRGAAAELPL